MRAAGVMGAAALATALAGCSHASQQPKLTAANARAAYNIGQRLAAQDRAQAARHRAEMARLIQANILTARDAARTISLYLRLHNLSARPIRSVNAALEIHDAAGERIGLAEIDLDKTVPAHTSIAFWYPIRYVRFGEDAGTMRLAAGKSKTIHVDVTEIRYADGSDAGYDD
jgi:hypothetical protein